jgi:hypothetical protein
MVLSLLGSLMILTLLVSFPMTLAEPIDAPALPSMLTLECADSMYEPNGNCWAPYHITPPTELLGFICEAGDVDWYSFDVAVGEEIHVILSSLPDDYDLFLYDPECAPADQSLNGGLEEERIDHVATASGAYRVQVFAPAGAHNSDDSYVLGVWLESPAPPTPTPTVECTDPYEPNETCPGARDVGAPFTLSARICSPTDEDWYVFWVDAGYDIVADLTNLPADYDLEIYDPYCERVAYSNAGSNTPEHAEHHGALDGPYAVRVFGYGGAHDPVEAYSLAVALPAGSATPTVTASPTPSETPSMTPAVTSSPTATSTPTDDIAAHVLYLPSLWR